MFSSIGRICQQLKEDGAEVHAANFKEVLGRLTMKFEYLIETVQSLKGRMRFTRKRATECTPEELGLTARVLVRPQMVEEDPSTLDRIFQKNRPF